MAIVPPEALRHGEYAVVPMAVTSGEMAGCRPGNVRVVRNRASDPIERWHSAGKLTDIERDGLIRPTAVTTATADYFDEQDVFGQWITEQCERGGAAWETSGTLFTDWSGFARRLGIAPGSSVAFAASLKKQGFAKSHKSIGTVWQGIRLRADANGAGRWPE